MRSLSAGLGLAVVAAVCAAALATDAKKDQPGAAMAARIQDLSLTDAQEARIADIQQTFRPKVQTAAQEFAAVVKEEVEKVRGVLTPEQKTKLDALKEERREPRELGLAERLAHFEELDLTEGEMARVAGTRKEYHPKIAKALGGLKAILTPDQQKAREAALTAGKKRREILAALDLPAEQKERAEAIAKEVTALVREEIEKILDVLTEGQKAQLQELKDERPEHVRDRMAHRMANLQDLNLTDAQKTQIAEIRKEYRPKVHEAGNKLRATVREEVEAIVSVLKG